MILSFKFITKVGVFVFIRFKTVLGSNHTKVQIAKIHALGILVLQSCREVALSSWSKRSYKFHDLEETILALVK